MGKYKKLTEERKEDLLNYLKEHPEITFDDICGTGFGSELVKFYKGRLNNAKEDAGVDVKFIRKQKEHKPITEERKGNFLNYLKEYPEATFDDICGAGFESVLIKFYKGRINDAKKDANIGKEYIKERRPLTEERKNEFLDWLKKNPDAAVKDIYNAGFESVFINCYKGGLNRVKAKLGIGQRYEKCKKDNHMEIAEKMI